MAIYSLHHSTVGRATHAAGTAGAHVAYVCRESAAREVIAERMPDQAGDARAWLDQAEASDRKNARVVDKLMVALPRELSPEQRAELVRDFAEQATQGRASWLGAIHDKGKDADNPHAHIVIRDKDPETGKRVAGLSEKGSTEKMRELWERTANAHLERAGLAERIDRRTLEAQGLERPAQIHVGPKALAMEARGVRPISQEREVTRWQLGQVEAMVIPFPAIDQGRTRAEANLAIKTRWQDRLREIAAEKARQAAAQAREVAQKAREAVARRLVTPFRQAAQALKDRGEAERQRERDSQARLAETMARLKAEREAAERARQARLAGAAQALAPGLDQATGLLAQRLEAARQAELARQREAERQRQLREEQRQQEVARQAELAAERQRTRSLNRGRGMER